MDHPREPSYALPRYDLSYCVGRQARRPYVVVLSQLPSREALLSWEPEQKPTERERVTENGYGAVERFGLKPGTSFPHALFSGAERQKSVNILFTYQILMSTDRILHPQICRHDFDENSHTPQATPK